MRDTSRPQRTGWQRLDRLHVKLFVAIAGTNLLLVMASYLVYSWSFDQGLVDYLNRADENRLTPVINRLADGWRRDHDWRWITEDEDRWPRLLREELGFRAGRREESRAAPPPESASGPRVLPPLTIDPRMLLLDAAGKVLLGPAQRLSDAVQKPIVVDGRQVGALAYVPRLQVVASLEQVFAVQQGRRFAAIALGLLAAVLLNAALVARWLARRLRPLNHGTAAVAGGDYSQRLPVRGHDEIAQLADGFNQMAAALQAAQQARQRWIADIAHELRTPLTTLRVEIEALMDGVREPDTRNLASLSQEVDRLTRLVDDLRTLSLSDLGALDYHFEPHDLRELLDDLLAEARHTQGLAVEMHLPDRPVTVRVDADRLGQLLRNLLQNTLRYTDAPARLRVGLEAGPHEARLTWEDSAPGVPAPALPRLTDRLYRVDTARARRRGDAEGSGLGLAIARAIAEAHGGGMEPSASPLGGLRWQVRLPLHAAGAGT